MEVLNRNTRKWCEIFSKLTIKIPERFHRCRSGFVINNEKINNNFDISGFIYSQRRFDGFLQSLSSSLIKCLQFQIFYTDFNEYYT